MQNAICPKGHFPLGGIFRAERHFLLFKDRLAESGREKTKENIIPCGTFRLVEDSHKSYIPGSFSGGDETACFSDSM